MTEQLKHDFDIIVLKTELMDSKQRTLDESFNDIRFTLECKVDGEFQSVGDWETSTRELGLREVISTGRGGDAVRLPDALLRHLRAWFAQDKNRDRPLWVHLVKPCGLLRFVPWERILGGALQVPILMLPDFIFPPPRESTATLDIVLCGSAPLEHEEGSVLRAISMAAHQIFNGTPRKARLHIFVDQHFADTVRKEWAMANRLGVDVFVYDNDIALKYVGKGSLSSIINQADTLHSPWLLWMREALSGRSIDVVHFCCHGHLMRDQGVILFAQSPLGRTDNYLAVPVGTMELQAFLTQVGAWSTVFTSMPDDNSEPGLRELADSIAQNRPGPMMMHVMAYDHEGSDLAKGYHFLFSTNPERAPRSEALFIYCQPYLSSDSGGEVVDISEPFSTRMDDLVRDLVRNKTQAVQIQQTLESNAELSKDWDEFFKDEDNVSPVVASTERFAEQVQLRYQKCARDELFTDRLETTQSVALHTINQLRSAVASELQGSSRTYFGSDDTKSPGDDSDSRSPNSSTMRGGRGHQEGDI